MQDDLQKAIEALPSDRLEGFLKEQRWYGAKAKALASARLLDVVVLKDEASPLAITLLRAGYDDGAEETYQLLLGLRAEPASGGADEIGEVDFRGERRVLYDALGDAAACGLVFDSLTSRDEFAGRAGRLVVRRGAPLPATHFEVDRIEPLSLEQSNSSVVFGDHLFLKVLRRVVFGLNPDYEINLFLTEHPLFHHSPRMYAALEYEGPEGPATLALLQEFVRTEGSGLDVALRTLKDYFDTPNADTLNAFAPAAGELGDVLGELHVALASDDANPEFAPEPILEEDVRQWWETVREHIEELEPCFAQSDEMRRSLWREVVAAFRELRPITDAGARMRNHGDYHLGQVLRAEKGWMILDFEGEPNRPLEERRRKDSPLRDVATMLRSFSYAAQSVVFERAAPGSDEAQLLRVEAGAWESAARGAFLEGYYGRMGDSPLLPARKADRQRLLNLFELKRAITELAYDLNNRPEWADICLLNMQRILGAA